MNPYFSIIIPAKNASRTLPQCLESIKAMDFPAHLYEVIVVNDASTDNTEYIAITSGVKVETRKFSCVAAVRNWGARVCCGQILVFLDSDMVVDRKWLAAAREYYFVSQYKGLLSFADHAPEHCGWLGEVWNSPLRSKNTTVRHVDYLPTRNLFVPRMIHEQVGGFDEKLFAGGRTGEDKEYTYRIFRLGFSVIIDPSLDMIHLGYERSLREFIKKEYWRQGSTLRIARKFGFPTRLLRNPFFGFIHISGFTLTLALPWRMGFYGLLTAAVLWFLPSTLFSIKRIDLRRYWYRIPHVVFTNWLRWNTAGFSLFSQLTDLLLTKPNKF